MKRLNININSRIPIWIHASIFVAIMSSALVLGYLSYNEYNRAQDSVFLENQRITENRTRLDRGDRELQSAKRQWEGALVLIGRIDKYRNVSNTLLSNNAASFKNMIDALAQQNRLFVASYEPQTAAANKFGNYTYDGRMFNMTLRGGYRDLGVFIASLENKVPLMEIVSLNIQEDAGNPGQLSAQMQVFIIRDIQESRAKVEANRR